MQTDSTKTADNIGNYTLTWTTENTSTAIETMAHGAYGSSFTEILTDESTKDGSGNDFLGEYDLTDTDNRSENFVAQGTDAGRSSTFILLFSEY